MECPSQHDGSSCNEKMQKNSTKQIAGLWRDLGELPAGAVVTEEALARIFGKHRITIKRAVQRGELPPPVRLFGVPVWTVSSLLNHIEWRLHAEKTEMQRQEVRNRQLSP